ncbi:glycosyltransferase family 2 protein [Alienimonas californiensis]|uniref:Glycosyltransferase EpsH n=1 Tax=Alienimonas californiensis TaxID=2527989 RepID=A0A517P476_9PLAN|nr:glycosyltransferase family A protein [Alienimonas californiensis]QDT14180.1 Putative glycosyltransferase EpsH [Alienimonas californiensis]
MNNFSVSAVIPCYNGAAHLRKAVASALVQTVPPREVIIIDDGSTDDSAAIAEAFGDPVRVLRQLNSGESVARNRGIEEAVGTWVAFLDADDLWEPTKIERQLALAGPGVVAVHTADYAFGAASYISDPGEEAPEQRYSLTRVNVRGNPCRPSSLLVRQACPARFPTWTRFAEDRIYTLELLRHGRIELVRDPLTGYRLHAGQQSASPDAAVERHRTMLRWLSEREGELDPAEVAWTRRASVAKLARLTEDAYWKRDWSAYWITRRYLEQYADHPTAAAALARRVPPAWLLRMKDSADRLLHRGCSEIGPSRVVGVEDPRAVEEDFGDLSDDPAVEGGGR